MIRRIFLLLLITLPTTTNANIIFTEVMYDLDGSDSKGEWVEIYNTGESAVDISLWRFNDGSNHKIAGGESAVVDSREYAILASDRDTFTAKYGSGGKAYDTVMSLGNSEETISLLDDDGVLAAEFSFSSSLGASGNGKSLQYVGGVWGEAIPTPLSGDVLEDEAEEVEENESEEVPEEEEEYVSTVHIEPEIRADAGKDVAAVASGMILFEGIAYGLENKPLKNARYLWNFGDGSFKEGQKVFHSYEYPGIYNTLLTVSSGEFASTDKKVVEVLEADVAITFADRGRIEISNKSEVELNLSFWQIKYKDKYFALPSGTFILPKSVGIFPASVTNLPVKNLEELSLLYPNGTVANTFLVPVESVPYVEPQVETKIQKIYVPVEVETKIEPEATEKEDAKEESLNEAAVIKTIESTENRNIFKWLGGLVSLLSIGSLAYISRRPTKESGELRARDIEVVND